MSLLHPSTHSEPNSHDERRGAIYLPDGLAVKLLCVCDAAVGLEISDPDSPIHSDLEDLWSNIITSSASSAGSARAEADVRHFTERYGLAHCLEGYNAGWFGEVGNLEKPSEDLYKELLEAAFGNQNSEAAYDDGGHDASSQIEDLFLNVSLFVSERSCARFSRYSSVDYPHMDLGLTCYFQFNGTYGIAISPPEITHSPSPDPPETPRIYQNRPHTPQVIYVNLAQKNHHDFWEISNLMKKPSLFPPTLRNIRNWIFWRRVHGRRQ